MVFPTSIGVHDFKSFIYTENFPLKLNKFLL